jgi:hypothetical protein
MVNAGLFVRMEAKAGKEKEAEDFLRSAEPIVQGEPGTVAVRRQLWPQRRSVRWAA